MSRRAFLLSGGAAVAAVGLPYTLLVNPSHARSEPVAPPVLALSGPLDEGEPVDVMVIRSERGRAGRAERWLLPPACAPNVPDPLAIGASMFAPDGAPGSVVKRIYPAGRSLRIILQGSGASAQRTVGGDDRTIVFALPEGHRITLRYSSLPDAGRLHEMAVWDRMDEAVRAAQRLLVSEGRHPGITPYREITLVHEVQPSAA